MTHGRGSLGVAVVVTMLGLPWAPGLGACSSSDAGSGPIISTGGPEAGGADTSIAPFDAGVGPVQDAQPIVFGDDANGQSVDGAPSSSCPGTAPPATTTGACTIDSTESCPPCASWGFVCAALASPQMQAVSASSFCRATATDGGTLVCCTQPACVVTTLLGGCGDASTQTRYDCSGGAVPTGTCTWLGPSSPDDYCCQ
jgi:hypothetical protein